MIDFNAAFVEHFGSGLDKTPTKKKKVSSEQYEREKLKMMLDPQRLQKEFDRRMGKPEKIDPITVYGPSMIWVKTKEGYIDIPKVNREDMIKRGLYLLFYKGKVIKVGCFGEGVVSNNKTRMASYRSMGRNLKPGERVSNGSYKTIKVVNDLLEVGDTIEVKFIELPDDMYLNGYRWKVDLYEEEMKLKEKYKDTLLLS